MLRLVSVSHSVRTRLCLFLAFLAPLCWPEAVDVRSEAHDRSKRAVWFIALFLALSTGCFKPVLESTTPDRSYGIAIEEDCGIADYFVSVMSTNHGRERPLAQESDCSLLLAGVVWNEERTRAGALCWHWAMKPVETGEFDPPTNKTVHRITAGHCNPPSISSKSSTVIKVLALIRK
jgi:hypothetical protein